MQKLKVFIGGQPPKITDEELLDHFGKIGVIKSCEIMKDPNTQEPRGFAFIIFKDKDAYINATSTPQTIKGRRIECKPALSKQKAKMKSSDEKGKKLFIGGLSLDTTEDELIQYFQVFGDIYKAYLIYDKNTNTSRGFGFVEFRNFTSAEKVVKEGTHFIKGKEIECKTILQKNELEVLSSKKVVKVKGQGQKQCNADDFIKATTKTEDIKTEDTIKNIESQEMKPEKVDFCTQTSYDDLDQKPGFANFGGQNTQPDQSISNSKEVQCDFSEGDMNSYYIDLESKLNSNSHNMIDPEMAYLSTNAPNSRAPFYYNGPNKSCNQNLINKNHFENSIRGFDTRSHQDQYMHMKNMYPIPNRSEMMQHREQEMFYQNNPQYMKNRMIENNMKAQKFQQDAMNSQKLNYSPFFNPNVQQTSVYDRFNKIHQGFTKEDYFNHMKMMQDAEKMQNYSEAMGQFGFDPASYAKNPNFMPKSKAQNEFTPNYNGVHNTDFYRPQNFEKKRFEQTYGKKHKTQPYNQMEEQLRLEKIFTENLLIGDENENTHDSPCKDKYLNDIIDNLGFNQDDSNCSKSNGDSHSLHPKKPSFENNSKNSSNKKVSEPESYHSKGKSLKEMLEQKAQKSKNAVPYDQSNAFYLCDNNNQSYLKDAGIYSEH